MVNAYPEEHPGKRFKVVHERTAVAYPRAFSPVWQLVPIGFLANNWIELRGWWTLPVSFVRRRNVFLAVGPVVQSVLQMIGSEQIPKMLGLGVGGAESAKGPS
ncbi:hypothetical protein TCAP_04846 [Tolypocladium capitatum]|uniref:Uncharacterized protein n=1 Tax=Tolypocladium capitatum TaxID=45235 RepID=A0A2K3QCH7_9HYPO|nr:hypothetical protein TCAP_04846 [Tolypocladium capitatum]